jgi:hypothetical protein
VVGTGFVWRRIILSDSLQDCLPSYDPVSAEFCGCSREEKRCIYVNDVSGLCVVVM